MSPDSTLNVGNRPVSLDQVCVNLLLIAGAGSSVGRKSETEITGRSSNGSSVGRASDSSRGPGLAIRTGHLMVGSDLT